MFVLGAVEQPALHATVDAQTVAIMLEPTQGEAGIIPATEQRYGVRADIITLGKGLGGGFLEHVRETGRYLEEGLARLAYRYDHGELRGQGLLWGLTLSDDCADAVVKEALYEGLILNSRSQTACVSLPR